MRQASSRAAIVQSAAGAGSRASGVMVITAATGQIAFAVLEKAVSGGG